MKRQVLLIEDDDGLRTSLAQTIELAGMIPLAMSGYVQARRHLRANFSGVVLSDIRMPHQDGFDVLRAARSADEELPVILLTGHSDVPTAMRAMKEGAWDYLEKPCSTERLVEVLDRAMAHREVVLRSRRVERQLRRNDPALAAFPGSGTVSSAFREQLRAAAEHRLPLHIYGAPGAGRRQAAQVINRLAPEPAEFVQLVVGHDAASALRQLGGAGVEADIVLVLPEGGDAESLHAAWQEVAAVHPDCRPIVVAGVPSGEVAGAVAGPDDPMELRVPSLEERREDIPEIFEVALRQAVGGPDADTPEVTEEVLAELTARPWSGNLPELREFARAVAFGGETGLDGTALTLAEQMEAFEKRVIEETLRKTGGKAVEAARLLGLPRNTLYDRLARYGISAKSFKPGQEDPADSG